MVQTHGVVDGIVDDGHFLVVVVAAATAATLVLTMKQRVGGR